MLFRKLFTSTSLGVMMPAATRIASLSPLANHFLAKPRLTLGHYSGFPMGSFALRSVSMSMSGAGQRTS